MYLFILGDCLKSKEILALTDTLGCLCQGWPLPGHRQDSQAFSGRRKPCCIQVRHWQVPPQGPGPPFAWTVDVTVAAQLGQAYSSDFW